MSESPKVRNYNPSTDYSAVVHLYKDSSTYGGQYDAARDSEEKLRDLSSTNPQKILVATINDAIVGTVTLFEDGRCAWLFRFAVQKQHESEIAHVLYSHATKILKKMGHSQVLVYSPVGNKHLDARYAQLGLTKGGDYTAFWKDI